MQQSITYMISSEDRTNNLADFVSEYDIDFGGFGSYTGDYLCEVKQIPCNGHFTSTLGFVMLTAQGLHSYGSHTNNLPSDEIPIGIMASAAYHNDNQGCSFVVPNLSIKRRVKFFLREPNQLKLQTWTSTFTDGDVNVEGKATQWSLIMKLTPIG